MRVGRRRLLAASRTQQGCASQRTVASLPIVEDLQIPKRSRWPPMVPIEGSSPEDLARWVKRPGADNHGHRRPPMSWLSTPRGVQKLGCVCAEQRGSGSGTIGRWLCPSSTSWHAGLWTFSSDGCEASTPKRRRDRCPAPPTRGAALPGQAAPAPPLQSCAARTAEPSASSVALVDLPGDAGNDPAVAPAAGDAHVDPALPSGRSSAAGRPLGGTDPAVGQREPPLGLSL